MKSDLKIIGKFENYSQIVLILCDVKVTDFNVHVNDK